MVPGFLAGTWMSGLMLAFILSLFTLSSTSLFRSDNHLSPSFCPNGLSSPLALHYFSLSTAQFALQNVTMSMPSGLLEQMTTFTCIDDVLSCFLTIINGIVFCLGCWLYSETPIKRQDTELETLKPLQKTENRVWGVKIKEKEPVSLYQVEDY